jgi:surfeit locus 1 family protein
LNGAPARRSLVVPAVATLGAVAVLIGLGVWQIERKQWKESLIAALRERLAAAPVELPPKARWAYLDRADLEFRRVRFRAEFIEGEEALVFTAGSTLRSSSSGPGFWVLAPARVQDGRVVVDRGFVPETAKEAAAHRPTPGAVEITGVLRWPDRRSVFTPADDPGRNLWFVRDPAAMAASKGWGDVAPFYVEQEAPAPASGLPIPGKLEPNLPNNHLQYAITWFGLAAVLVGMFGTYVWGIVRR